MDIYSALYRWNLWGDWEIPKNYPRQITEDIIALKETPEIMSLIGPRRAGKSTILYQVMDSLVKSGVEEKSILHVNLEEPEFLPYLNLSFLDELYKVYRTKVYPKGKVYIFLDEIQNIPQWERWIRARNESENIKIWLTGSSSSLLSRELATLLTGRHITFSIHPLSFQEVLQFKNISLPQEPLPSVVPSDIQHALFQYMEWGGFPRIVLAKNDNERVLLLKQYFDEIILKDIIQRYEIRDVLALRNIAIYALTNTGALFSYKRMSEIFQVSLDLAKMYLHYLQEAFIIDELGIFRLKASERSRNPVKIHAVDLGLRRVVNLSMSPDYGKLIETIVYNHIASQNNQEIFYWKGEAEVDILTRKGIQVDKLIQVAYDGVEEPKVLHREIKALEEALIQYPKAKAYLIVGNHSLELEKKIPSHIKIIPLWQFLLYNFQS